MRLLKSQEQIYSMCRIAGKASGNICGRILFKIPCSTARMNEILNQVFAMNDAFSMRLLDKGDHVELGLVPYESQKFEVLHFSCLDDLDAFGESMAKQPIDLCGPLYEFKIVVVKDMIGIAGKFHHIIGDAWSVSLLGNQIHTMIFGGEPQAYSYRDYILAQKKYPGSPQYEKDQAFFAQEMKKGRDAARIVDRIPTSFHALRKTFLIDYHLTERIKAYAATHQVFPYAVLLTATAVCLSRLHNNAEKFFIGFTLLNRSSKTDVNTFGLFMGTVPMLIELRNEQSFSENLSGIIDKSFSTIRHAKYGYGEIQKLPISGTGRLFDVLFNYQTAKISGKDTSNKWYHNGSQVESLQININDHDDEGILRVSYDYLTDIYTEQRIESLHGCICQILESALEADDPICRLPMMNKKEQGILCSFNRTSVPVDNQSCVCQRITQQAVEHPDKICLIGNDRVLDYGMLESESNRIANALLSKGIAPGDIVAVKLPRTTHLITVLLAIMKCGAAYLPIDPELPQERIDYILRDSLSKLCITETELPYLCACRNSSAPEITITPDMWAYCIYTSGSTGKPKGVVITHQNLSNYVAPGTFHVTGQSIHPGDTIVSVTTISFDIFVTESLLPLANGMTAILADEEQSRSQKKLNELLLKCPADVLQTTPTKMKLLMADPGACGYLRNLRCMILGGEPVSAQLVAEVRKWTEARIYNYYGPTETTVWATCADVTDGDLTIGTPLANTSIHIMDQYGNLVPAGTVGELCIGGAGVGAGYLHQPELTAEKFIDNPFGTGKLYKTGDLAYWRRDGKLIYVGRNDFQVKIHGQRVELGEIERVLNAEDGIQHTAAVVQTDAEGRQILCAFYTGAEKSVPKLRRALNSLPRHMIPHTFVHLEKMPLTSSGKIDRNALPKVALKQLTTDVVYVAPETPEEHILITSVNQVLHRKRTSMLDQFLQVGGDSLKSIELISLLEGKGYTLPARKILSGADMRELAKMLAEKAPQRHRSYGHELPATAAQLRIYTAQELLTDGSAYHITLAFHTDKLDKDALQRALDQLIARHESLRTHFENRDGSIWQVIDKRASIAVEEFTSADAIGKAVSFDLGKSPLFRVGYFGDTLQFVFHHIIMDGSAIPVFFRELNALYMGRSLPDEITQYGEFAAAHGNMENDRAYWRDVFQTIPDALEMGNVVCQKMKSASHAGIYHQWFNAQVYGRIERLCMDMGITPFAYCLGAYGVLLSRYFGSHDFAIGVPMSGRDAEYLNTIGMFVNTTVIRYDINDAATVEEYLGSVGKTAEKARAHQNYPYSALLKDLGCSPTEGLFSVMFSYQRENATEVLFADEQCRLLLLDSLEAKYPLSLFVLPEKHNMMIAAEYQTELFDEQFIAALIHSYCHILEQMLDADRRLSAISAFSETDRAAIAQFNDTDAPYPQEKSIYDLALEQAEKAPDGICLLCPEKPVTRHYFLSKAAQLDGEIRKITGGRKQIIGVIADRSPEMYLAIYAIIRGGNAYLPIQPSDPVSRIAYILEDSEAQLVLVQEQYAPLACGHSFLNVSEIWEAPRTGRESVVPPTAGPEDVAYVIYTSGSTGRPKGVMIRNRSVVNRVLWMQKRYPLTRESVILAKTPYTFDVSVWEIFWWGMCGGKLAYMKPGEHFLPKKIVQNVETYQVTHLHFVPSVFSLFLDYLADHPGERGKLRWVQHIFLSGEELTVPLVRKYYSMYPEGKLHNLYGPTECTVDVSYYDCTGKEEGTIPIGRPIDNTRLYVVNKNGEILPPDIKGELCIAGAGVGVGYLNRPELTEKKFVKNTFGSGTLYKTGDIVYLNADGQIVFCGRMDAQVKLHGQRLELSEIENVLLQMPGVRTASVLLREVEGKTGLTAFYTGEEVVEEQLRQLCAKHLPAYMIPAFFVCLHSLPMNKNGKLDRKSLMEYPIERTEQGEIEPPINDMERMICDSFCSLLSIAHVGRNTDFLAAGGTSLDIISFLYSNEQFAKLSAADFLKDPTPAGIARQLDNQKANQYFHILHYVPAAEHLLVLIPFAGGNAESYAALVAALRKQRPDLTIGYIDFFHSMQECRRASEEIAKAAEGVSLSFYAHCVGNALALQLVPLLEKDFGIQTKALFAGAFIPPKTAAKRNVWEHTPAPLLKQILKKAGSRIDELPEEIAARFISDFRTDTSYALQYFRTARNKIHTPVYGLLSQEDFFTGAEENAEHLWSRDSDGRVEITRISASTHYFQSDHAETVAAWITERL